MYKIRELVNRNALDKLKGKYTCVYSGSKCIAKGKVIWLKTYRSLCISFDRSLFFNINYPRYDYIVLDEEVSTFIDVEGEIITSFRYDGECNYQDDRYGVFQDATIDECDAEIKNLVTVMNKIKYCRTTGSCSGHGEVFPYVSFELDTFLPIILIAECIADSPDLSNICYIRTDPRDIAVFDYNMHTIAMRLIIEQVGEAAYQSIELLSKLISAKLESNKDITL